MAFNETTGILEDRRRFGDRSSSIDSAENAPFDDMKQLIGDEEPETTSLKWASFNYINSVLGSGVIGMPYALHEAGFGLGLLLLFLVAFITDYSLILMVRAGHLCGRYTYQGIMEAAFGRPGYILLSILQFVYPFIAMVSYNVIVGDTVTKVIVRITGCEVDDLIARREFVVFVATLLITIPLCLYRDIAKLAKISFISLLCLAFIMFSVFVRVGPMKEIVPSHSDNWRFANWDIIPAIGIMAFAFMCHHNTFLLYTSIDEASQKKWDRVTHVSISTSAIVAFLFGISGYATFAAYSQGDLLENYCFDDDLMNFCRILFSIQILLTFPIECFVSREVLELTVFRRDDINVPISERAHYLITLAIIGASYIISMATDCLGVVLELNGVLAAVPLAYLLPAGVYLRLEEGSLLSRKKLPALCVCIFGLMVATLGTLFLFWDFDEIDTCSHGQAMFYCENRTHTSTTLVDFH
ncbi:putative sodium-coupled neutral amino acid transporter 11 [Atheta coriaria]|uniref:putative sodium-coupled neutral amino acid transporter 11 n=1 Tax=Dalotia coriaria TaxID=877792 RepID=UPI0031F39926